MSNDNDTTPGQQASAGCALIAFGLFGVPLILVGLFFVFSVFGAIFGG